MAQWKTAPTASGLCVCGVAWLEFDASRPVCGCNTTRDAAEVMWDLGKGPTRISGRPPMRRATRFPVGCDGADGPYGITAYLSRPGPRLFMYWRWAHGCLPSHL